MGFSSIVRSYRNWQRVQRTYNELNRLSVRELNDLGIAPGDVRAIARQSVLSGN